RQAPRLRRWLRDEGVRELDAATRSAADHALELRIHREERQPDALQWQARVAQALTQLTAREVVPIAKGPLENGGAADQRGGVELLPPGVRREQAGNPRGRQSAQPPDIRGPPEKAGRPHDVGGGGMPGG